MFFNFSQKRTAVNPQKNIIKNVHFTEAPDEFSIKKWKRLSFSNDKRKTVGEFAPRRRQNARVVHISIRHGSRKKECLDQSPRRIWWSIAALLGSQKTKYGASSFLLSLLDTRKNRIQKICMLYCKIHIKMALGGSARRPRSSHDGVKYTSG